jgi:probable addiction module antidote protein
LRQQHIEKCCFMNVTPKKIDALNAALATNELGPICYALDAAIRDAGGVVAVARAARLDRTTLYRAFRVADGADLRTMLKTLRAMQLQLIVEVNDQDEESVGSTRRVETAKGQQREIVGRRLTTALKTGRTRALLRAFAGAVHSQQNVTELAQRVSIRRETLYRVFGRHPNARLNTLLRILNALGLRFAVRRVRIRDNQAGGETAHHRPSRYDAR